MAKSTIKIVSTVVLLLIGGAGAFLAVVFVPNWVAERRAREFCDRISIGSNISAAIADAKERKILWGAGEYYTFYFPGLIMDKAVCDVSVTHDGKVKAKSAVLEID